MHAVTTVTLQFWFDHKALNGGPDARRFSRYATCGSRFSATICSSAKRPTATA